MSDFTVVSLTNKTDIIKSTTQGPPGPPGDTAIFIIADIPIGGHRVVKATLTGCDYADNTNLNDLGKVIGMTKSAYNQGDSIAVYKSVDITESSWNWALGPVYLGTNGTLTQTVPTVGFLQQIGIAISPTRVLINIQPPIEVI